jgi:excisionase family DNA binding protein
MAFTVGADRFESAGQGSFSGTTGAGSGRIELEGSAAPFLTSAQAAELTERSERGIRKACERGKLPAQKFGNVWHINPRDLDNYVHRREPVAAVEEKG